MTHLFLKLEETEGRREVSCNLFSLLLLPQPVSESGETFGSETPTLDDEEDDPPLLHVTFT